jgi:hypothetical protein
MLGIGLFPFILFPWAFIGPIMWGNLAINMWPRNRPVAYVSWCITAISIVAPLVSWLWSFGHAGVAGFVIAIPSFFLYLLTILIIGIVRFSSIWRARKSKVQ